MTATPGSGSSCLLYSQESSTSLRTTTAVAEVVLSAGAWSSLAHVASALGEVGGGDMVETLIERGFLVDASPENDSPQAEAATSQIERVLIPTCNRPATVVATASAYGKALHRSGRTASLLVGDDALDPATVEQTRSALRALASNSEMTIEYLGRNERSLMVDVVAAAAEVDKNVVAFLLDPRDEFAHGRTTVGANRNSLMIECIGEMVVCADDDVRPRLSRTGPDSISKVTSHGNHMLGKGFTSREVALRSCPETLEDPLWIHEQWLGRAVPTRHDSTSDLSEMSARDLRHARERRPSVALTLTGILGDCAWDNPDVALTLDPTGPIHSREWLQGVTSTTLTPRPDPVFGMCMGWNNKSLLPPFTPIGRAEDVAFGALFGNCFPDSFAAYLPVAMLHEPAETRRFSTEPPTFDVGPGLWMAAVVGTVPPGPDLDPTARLARVGTHVRGLSKLPERDFENFLQYLALESLKRRMEGLSEDIPAGTLKLMEKSVNALERAASSPISSRYLLSGGFRRAQELLGRWGDAIRLWPTVREAASAVKQSGRRFADPA